jgi:hypothetical protein
MGPPQVLKNPITVLKCLIMSFTARDRDAAAASQDFFKNGRGYYVEQSAKPQTLRYSLADLPVGLLAWIYEKLVTWTDSYPWTDDEGELKPARSHLKLQTQLNWFHSTHVDLDLLVLVRGPRSVHQDLL